MDLYNDMSYDIENIDIDEKVDYNELSTELLKSRLARNECKITIQN
jgi:membrane-bound lytic murein transglycosylase D